MSENTNTAATEVLEKTSDEVTIAHHVDTSYGASQIQVL